MPIPFIKMNGLGNDFVFIDQRQHNYQLSDSQYVAIADRKSGIGCDQIILLEQPPENRGGNIDVTMRIFNSSGGEVEACGNASRCVGGLLMDEMGRDRLSIFTKGGLIHAKKHDENPAWISVDMGEPKFGWKDIPLSEEFHDTSKIELAIGPYDAPILHSPAAVNVGNPHAVFFVDKEVDSYALDRFGPLLETHPIFPEKANISIAEVKSDTYIKARVWERGAGLTLACGTGACAIGICAMRKNYCERRVSVELPGGILEIQWLENNHIIMSGDWTLDGRYTLPEELIA